MKKTATSLVTLATITTSLTFNTEASASEEVTQAPHEANTGDPQDRIEISQYSFIPKPFRFSAQTDRPHFSTSGGPKAVSVHGWWNQISGPAKTATVRIELWAKGPHDQGFRKVGTGIQHSIPPGGGRGNRATARSICKNSDLTVFRGDVDVDINGYLDPPGTIRGTEVTLPCGV